MKFRQKWTGKLDFTGLASRRREKDGVTTGFERILYINTRITSGKEHDRHYDRVVRVELTVDEASNLVRNLVKLIDTAAEHNKDL